MYIPSSVRRELPLMAGSGHNILVLADVMWVVWGPLVTEDEDEQPWLRYDRFLHRLLGAPASEGVSAARLDGWLLHDPERDVGREELCTSVAPIAAPGRTLLRELGGRPVQQAPPPAESSPGPDGPNGHLWLTGRAGGAELLQMVRDIRQCNLLCNSGDPAARRILAPLLNLQACRVYLSGEQVRRLTGRPDGPTPPHACLDIRFRSHIGRYWLYATLSLWTSRPASRAHAPDESAAAARAPSWPAGGGGTITALRNVRTSFEKQLIDAFSPLRLNVFDKPYAPPQFWVAAGPHVSATPAGDGGSPIDDVAGIVLGSRNCPTNTITAGSAGPDSGAPDTGVGMDVRRRFVPDRGGPRYLILPDRSQPRARQEDTVRTFIYAMTRLEAEASATLFDITTDVDILRALAETYEHVAKQGSELWDELSMYFPTAGGKRLDRAHEQADLIHQVLLQGIADLELVHTSVSDLEASVLNRSHGLSEKFDTAYTERATDDDASIGRSLRTGGYVGLTDRFIDQTRAQIERARETYHGLLEGVTRAFDERRVRLTDKVPVLTLLAAFVLAGAPLVTEAWGAVLAFDRGLWKTVWPYWVAFAVGLATAVSLVWFAIHYRRATFGELKITDEFRTQYDELRRYMQDCRTDRLWQCDQDWRGKVVQTGPGLDRPAQKLWASYFGRWAKEDERLSRRCADRLDAIARLHSGSKPKDSLEDLRHRIERWALVALFATERPRHFYEFPLPRLTLLYCAYPVWNLFPKGQGCEGPPLVAASDLRLLLRVHCRAHPDEVEWVGRWTERLREEARRENLDARAVRDRIATTNIRAGIPRKRSAPTYRAIHDPH